MKNWLKIITAFFIGLSACSQAGILSETDFTKTFLISLQKANSEVIFTIKKDMVIESEYNSEKFAHDLDNAYAEYKQEPDSLESIISKYMVATTNLYIENKNAVNPEKIIPVIKPVEYLDEIKAVFEGEEPRLVYQEYNEQLIIVFAEDSESNIKYFTDKEFSKTGIDKDTLLDFAVENLKKILPDIQSVGGDGSFGLIAGGNYETSLLLIKSLWIKDNFEVDGEIVIAIPNRDLLFITGSNNIKEIARIRKVAEESNASGSQPVSPYLFIWTGERFELYKQ